MFNSDYFNQTPDGKIMHLLSHFYQIIFGMVDWKHFLFARIALMKPYLLSCPNTDVEALFFLACPCAERLSTTIGTNFRFKDPFWTRNQSSMAHEYHETSQLDKPV